MKFRASILILLIGTFIPSCDGKKEGAKPPEREKAVAEKKRRSRESPLFQSSTLERQRILSELKPLNEDLLKESDDAIVRMCEDLIKGEGLIPNSDASKNLVYALSVLLSRNADLAYQLMNSMPPGYHSEDIVGQVFSRSDYASLGDVMKIASPLQDPDFFRIALERGGRSYLIRATSGEVVFDMSTSQLNELKAAGVTRQVIVDLLIEGLLTKSLPLSVIAENFSKKDNLLMKRVVDRLPLEQSKTAVESIYNSGERIDKPTLKAFASRLAVEDAVVAMDWVSKLPDSDRITGIAAVTGSWMAASPMEASKYVSGMQPGAEQDAAVGVIVDDLLLRNNTKEAVQWINSISDKELREKKMAAMSGGSRKGN